MTGERKDPPDRAKEFSRQVRLQVYGDGPYDTELGHPCGCEDVATLALAPGFCVVRKEYLDELEQARPVVGYVSLDGARYMPKEIFDAWEKLRATADEADQWLQVTWRNP